ncbi:MAG: hypothetical protein RL516_2084 [Bacteroidota bacterium]|jgi:hypothetical protein
MYIIKILLLNIILAFTTLTSSAQKLTYKVKVDGKESGTLIANKSGKKNNYTYTIQSNIKTTMLFTVELKYDLKSIIENGRLKSSRLVQLINGVKQTDNTTTQKGSGYVFKDKSGEEKIINSNITIIVPELYFAEPKNQKVIWSDNHGKFLSMKKEGDSYLLDTGDGQNSTYTYVKGICKKVESTQAFSNITFELVK